MDVTPQLLRDVEFKEQRKGYDTGEVRAFLARLADAVARLQGELGAALERAARAERRLLDAPAEGDELSRTLVLAQRTAEAALSDARTRAAELVADAEAQAATVTADADARAVATTGAADEHAARVVAEAETRVATELRPLLEQREALQRDVTALQEWAATVRARLADEVREHLARLDGGGPELPPAPPLVDVHLPEAVATADDAAQPVEAPVAAPEADGDAGPPQEPTAVLDLRELEAERHGADDSALALAAVDDPFLAELRRAVTDDEPLGPRDRVVVDPGGDDVGHHDDLLGPASVFRRKKRH